MLGLPHTRAEEESGRDELIRGAAVSRLMPLAAAVVLALATNAVLGVLVAASLMAYGLPVAGSTALGAALATTGWVFTGVTAVAAQLTFSARASYAITGAAIGAAYFARAVGDTGLQAVSWSSPIGWGQPLAPTPTSGVAAHPHPVHGGRGTAAPARNAAARTA